MRLTADHFLTYVTAQLWNGDEFSKRILRVAYDGSSRPIQVFMGCYV